MAEPIRFQPWHAAIFLGAVTAISLASSRKGDKPRYKVAKTPKPPPPAWVFPVVWSGLNILQLYADLRILNRRDDPDRAKLIGLRGLNWLLYGLLTPAFFRAQSPKLGEAVTLAEGVTAGATVALLAKRDPWAALALAPLPLWSAYAGLFGCAADAPERNPDQMMDRMRRLGGL